ncbi:MAG: EAL domain-containing protein [Pseudomonadota bacterium]
MDAGSATGIRHSSFWVIALVPVTLVASLMGAVWWVLSQAQDDLITSEALRTADVVSQQTVKARAVYTDIAVEKLAQDGFGSSEYAETQPGHIPLPAQYLKALAKRSQSDGDALYEMALISRWNLGEGQGLDDDFQRWAWQSLSSQRDPEEEGATDWQPVWRVEPLDGVPTLRFVRADPAVSASCVNCHNALEKQDHIVAIRTASGEKPRLPWVEGDLMGALEVRVPLGGVTALARSQASAAALILGAILLFGTAMFMLIIRRDRAQSRRQTRELIRQAHSDPLTGLPNRLRLETELNTLLGKSHGQHALLSLDLNEFKQINDTIGHHAGDRVLKVLSKRLLRIIGQRGVVARMGGDEFVVLLPDQTRADAERVALAINTVFEDAVVVDGVRIACGTSIGIALAPEHANDPVELSRCVDIAMYEAKVNRLPFAVYSRQRDEHDPKALSMADDFRRALRENELALFFQPQYDIKCCQMVGAEALVRWHHPQHGQVDPERIVELAEQNGLVSEFTDWMLNTALHFAKVWRMNGFELSVSVNVTSADLHDLTLVERVMRALERYRLPPETLTLEVTESSMMKDPIFANDLLCSLARRGVKVAVDDYGTGYCSMSYITQLPVSELKLDRSFCINLFEERKGGVLVSATIGLAHALGLTIVAEGVEDVQTLEYLSSHGCDVVQGFFFSKPVPAELLSERLPRIYQYGDEPFAKVA